MTMGFIVDHIKGIFQLFRDSTPFQKRINRLNDVLGLFSDVGQRDFGGNPVHSLGFSIGHAINKHRHKYF